MTSPPGGYLTFALDIQDCVFRYLSLFLKCFQFIFCDVLPHSLLSLYILSLLILSLYILSLLTFNAFLPVGRIPRCSGPYFSGWLHVLPSLNILYCLWDILYLCSLWDIKIPHLDLKGSLQYFPFHFPLH